MGRRIESRPCFQSVKEAISEAQNDIRNKNSMLDGDTFAAIARLPKFISRFLKFCRNNQPAKYLDELHRHQEERRTEKGDTVFLQAPT